MGSGGTTGWRTRLVVEASAVADLGLRTALASMVSLTALPWTLSGGPRAERERLRLYRELAEQRDARAVFAAPAGGVEVTAQRAAPLSFRASDGRVDVLRFTSPFVPLHPDMRDSYAAFARNRTAWAQHWRHADGPRPTLCVIHGFGASPYWFNSAFFALPWFYGQGYDVLQYVLPFHGLRQHPLAPVRGSDYFSHGIAHMNEAVIQAIHDFRVFLDHLFTSGVPRVAVTGLSLGGYMSALLAAVEERLHIVIPNAPVTDVAALVRTWFPANMMIAAVARVYGLAVEELEQAVALHCPLRYPPLVPRERLMIIGGLGDRLAPPEQSRALWTHWGEPRLHWYAGNHAVHVSRGDYLREMRRFFVAGGFVVS